MNNYPTILSKLTLKEVIKYLDDLFLHSSSSGFYLFYHPKLYYYLLVKEFNKDDLSLTEELRSFKDKNKYHSVIFFYGNEISERSYLKKLYKKIKDSSIAFNLN